MEKENIYLKALEIGFNSKDEGISFNEMKSTLSSLGYKFEEKLLSNWYYVSFEHVKRVYFSTNPSVIGMAIEEDNNKYSLCSDSLFQYLEYVELKEARENSKSAKNYSLIAIGIALLSLLASLGTLVISNYIPQQVSEQKLQIQLKELLKVNNGNQKVLDSSLYELRKLVQINDSIKQKQGIEKIKK
jgi:site-specific DNA-cytosine methylase